MAFLFLSSKGCVILGVYQHFREEEHPFIDQVYSWTGQVKRTYERRLTDFLNPREQEILQMIIGENNSDFIVKFSGGHAQAERKRAIIAPFYEDITSNCFELSLLAGTYNEKFMTINHRDVMGTFLSLGIDRSKLGDIIISEGLFQFVTDETIVDYLLVNFVSIKRTRANLQRQSLSELKKSEHQWQSFEKIVPSLRLDAFISSLYNISRKQATSLIERGYVKVNHKTVEQLAFLINEGDLISVRGKGRGKFIKTYGRTRKDNLRIKTAILKDNI